MPKIDPKLTIYDLMLRVFYIFHRKVSKHFVIIYFLFLKSKKNHFGRKIHCLQSWHTVGALLPRVTKILKLLKCFWFCFLPYWNWPNFDQKYWKLGHFGPKWLKISVYWTFVTILGSRETLQDDLFIFDCSRYIISLIRLIYLPVNFLWILLLIY